MAKQVYGIYDSEEEAIKVVNGLELKGFKAKNIVIFTNKTNKRELKRQTDVKIESTLNNEEDTNPTFMDKVRKFFMKNKDESLDIRDKLLNLGISEEQIVKCINDIESGKILVIADNTLRMGHAPPNDSLSG